MLFRSTSNTCITSAYIYFVHSAANTHASKRRLDLPVQRIWKNMNKRAVQSPCIRVSNNTSLPPLPRPSVVVRKRPASFTRGVMTPCSYHIMRTMELYDTRKGRIMSCSILLSIKGCGAIYCDFGDQTFSSSRI